MRKHKDFMNEPDYGYIDIESCFEPIFEPPLETLEEWRRWEDEPEPTLENTSVYVTEPDGIQYFYCVTCTYSMKHIRLHALYCDTKNSDAFLILQHEEL